MEIRDLARFFITASSAFLPLALVLIAALAATGCSRPTTLQEVKEEGVLHVITRVAPSIYYEGREAATGYDYELARRFADDLGVELRVRVAEDNSEILSVLTRDYAHIGLAGLTRRPEFEDKFRTVPIGVQAQSVVVYHRDYPRPSSLSDLAGETLHLLTDSNHEHIIADHPDGAAINRQVHPGLDVPGLLARVESGEIAYAAVSSNELDLNHVYFPMVKDGFALDEPRELVWLFPADQDRTLANAATEFLAQARDNGSMAQLAERFYGHLDRLNYVGARTFMHHVENRLPKYQSLFQGYADEAGLDWRLLAAIGYQESHWRPNAVSPTGVRGLMMLTRTTASYIGINNRLDPEESIEGGARYFRMVHAKIPDRIPEPDRTWFALASYNVGYGHLEDARRLTQSGGKNPDRWMDVKEFLPLLAQKEWYTQTRFGYARGHEPVVYVQNIRRYYDVLTRITEPDQPESTPTRELAWLEHDAKPASDKAPVNDSAPELRAALPPELSLIPPTL
ncbi:MAG: putative soluble lytic transglycosylase fused to an ABC-type amino acid-binding protein [Marinobacter excellens HL-55]|uniref:Membrane-bound lytic murein transglycosylase F n=1 Tax=Marinobacter excellens HL-55 TaxID=1305731 RepID=A0A0P8CVT4_9GAMM|nr:MAG: putative soluble lytic transglycosylase fused to an ABC-type amino acid-binding protein [Marinobacter excellens HL-55]